MSGNYTAGQCDHAFKPSMLCNWELGTNDFPGKFAICSPTKCGCTNFIADDNGRLCCNARPNCCTSPWGDYATCIWEDTLPCCCAKAARRLEEFKPPCDIYITNEVRMAHPPILCKDISRAFITSRLPSGPSLRTISVRKCGGQLHELRRPLLYPQVFPLLRSLRGFLPTSVCWSSMLLPMLSESVLLLDSGLRVPIWDEIQLLQKISIRHLHETTLELRREHPRLQTQHKGQEPNRRHSIQMYLLIRKIP